MGIRSFAARLSGTGGYVAATSPLERRLRQISARERREEARAFLEVFHDAAGAGQDARTARWATVRRDLGRHGYYEHTPEELAFGARLAWRNTGKCIGRLPWDSLEVADCRALTRPEDIATQIGRHLREAQSDGRVRPMMSVFRPVEGPVEGRRLPAWIESGQILRYAGHPQPDGGCLGDRRNIEATRIARALGWSPPSGPGRFDLLPWLMRDEQDRRHQFELPAGSVREVPITDPDHPALAALGLRWYAVPMVSDMILTIGGIDYPCAPFNGYYMGTEIASRNLVDADRFDLLPAIAAALGTPADAQDPIWRDEALTRLNRAVLRSFRAAGVTMVDHHTASDQFMTFHRREQAAGRAIAADWRWIVPPQAGAACEVFHLKMRNFHPVPNFYRDRGGDGLRLMPWYGDRHRSRGAIWADRIMRRWKLWKRMPW